MFEGLFREPDGWRMGGLWAGIGLAFLGLYGFFRLLDGGETAFTLHFGLLCVVMGVPELLPKERTQIAGGLRILGMVLAAALVVFYLSQLSIFQ